MQKLLAVLALAVPLFVAGCDQGPMEEAGEDIDRAVEDTGDAIEESSER